MRKLLLILCIWLPIMAHASSFSSNGIYYNTTSATTVEVTWKSMGTTYSASANGSLPSGAFLIDSHYDDEEYQYVLDYVINDYAGSITIPSTVTYGSTTYSVTGIGDYAMAGCTSLTSVSIPSSVTGIGDYAMAGCTSLTSVSIPSSVTRIGFKAFYGCSSMTYASLPYYLKSLGSCAFEGCSSLNSSISFPSTLTYVGGGAFSGCSSLTSVDLGTKITAINNTLFNGCSSLTYISIPSSVTRIEDNAFSGCKKLTTITIPSSVTFIGASAFMNCSSMKTITIPSSVTTIQDNAFSGCTGTITVHSPAAIHCEGWVMDDDGDIVNRYFFPLANSSFSKVILGNEITQLPDDRKIWLSDQKSVFNNCKQLKSIDLPNTITYIGSYAFEGCSKLTTIAIPASVTHIASNAFKNCQGLKGVTFYKNTPPIIASSAFVNVSKAIPVYVMAGCTSSYQASTGLSGFTNIIEITSSNKCGANLYWELNGSTVTISGIGDMYNYDEFSSSWSYSSSITQVVIMEGATSIGNKAFYNCYNLSNITIPASISHVGNEAFRGCSNISNIQGGAATGDNKCAIVNDTLAVFASAGLTSYSIPDGVIAIGKYAMSGSNSLASVTMPSSLRHIGERAFFNCTSLSSITIPDGVSQVEKYAFSECSSLSSISLPSNLTRINEGTFDYCTSLVSITIPESVISIGEAAFWHCSQLTNVSLPEGLRTFGSDAFYGCSRLTAVTIPSSVTYMGDNVFVNSGLKHLTINCNVGYAYPSYHGWFYNTSITDVVFGENVTYISDNGFYGCTQLTSITCKTQEAPVANASAFSNVPTSATIYVPCGSLSNYESANVWTNFSNIQEYGCSYHRDVTSGRYGTICLPKAVAHEDIQGGVFFKIVYAVTNTNDEVTGILMEEETEGLEAGMPYIFRATADELVLPYTGEAVAEPVAANGLVGNLSETPMDVPQGMYVLSNNQIRKLAGGTATAGQNRAYIDLTNVTKLNYVPAAAPNRVVLNVEGSNVATDLENIKSEDIQKVIRDGQVLILRDGKTYNVLGNTL